MNNIVSKQQLEKTVRVSKNGAYVKSDDIAKIFEKQHKVVLKMIDNKIQELEELEKDLIDTKLCRLISNYFKQSNYIDSKGRTYRRFNLTRKGFDLVVLSMTGKKALRYKLWYIDEFHKKTEIIQKDKQLAKEHLSNDMFVELRNKSKDVRRLFTDVIQHYELPQRIEEGKDASRFVANRITTYTKLVYNKLNLIIPKGDNPRDVFEPSVVMEIVSLENHIGFMIKINSKNGIHYKESYKLIKKEILGE